jgi:hypothetical protein
MVVYVVWKGIAAKIGSGRVVYLPKTLYNGSVGNGGKATKYRHAVLRRKAYAP